MAILNILFSTTVNPPSGLWEFLLRFFERVSKDYAWRIIIFTILLKLILSPLDFYQRYKMKKNERINKKLQPEMDKLNRQYADDRTTLSQKTMQLQKQAGVSYFSACIPMLVTIVVFFSFWSGMRNIAQYEEFKQYVNMYDIYIERYYELSGVPFVEGTGEISNASQEFDNLIDTWGNRLELGLEVDEQGLIAYRAYKAEGDFSSFYQDYLTFKEKRDFYIGNEILKSEYNLLNVESFDNAEINRIIGLINTDINNMADKPDFITTLTDRQSLIDLCNDMIAFDQLSNHIDKILSVAEADSANSVWLYYKDNKPSFWWIKSIWVADVPWANAVSDYATFTKNLPRYMSANEGGLEPSVFNEIRSEETYNKVISMVRGDSTLSKNNGKLFLAILAVGLSFLSTFITSLQQKKSGQQLAGQMGNQMKIMMFIMPIMIGIFALSSSSAFTLYMMTNSFMSLIITFVATFFVNLIGKRHEMEEISSSGVIRYGRKDPNDKTTNKRSK